MSEIHAVLLIPAEGDPHGLLSPGVGGSRPPMAFKWDTRYHRLKEDDGRWAACGSEWPNKPGDALVLAWDGKVVPAGVFAAWWQTDDSGAHDMTEAMDMRPDWLGNEVCGRWLRDGKPIGTIVLLDADGKEVADVQGED